MKQTLPVKQKGIRKLFTSFSHAFHGIFYAFSAEQNMFIHVMVMCFVIVCGFFFQISLLEWLFCLVMFGLVLATELMNTAIESVVDLITKEYHPLAKVAKDTSAGAVFVFALTAVVGGCIIFLPKVIHFIAEFI